MSYKNPNSSTKKPLEDNSRNSIIFWILLSFTVLFLFWAPFQKGLFNGNTFDFERPLFSSFVWASIILFLISLYLFYQWKLRNLTDFVSIGVWLIPLSFLISLSSSASSYYAANSVFIQLLYVTFFLLGMYITRSEQGASILGHFFMGSAYFIVIFGFFNWLGNKSFIFKLVSWFSSGMSNIGYYKDAIMTDANGVRLTSVFQYANSYAAFLIAILLCSIYLSVTSKKWVTVVIHASMTVPIIISFFLTLSRGGLVILPIVLLLVLPFLKPYKQLLYILQTIVSFVISLIILNKITTIGVALDKQDRKSVV